MFRLFAKKQDKAKKSYDAEKVEPVIKSSICTGEKVAGFQDKETKHIEEVMLIRNDADLETFRREYGILGEIKTIY